jgi:4-alpha-glucanotransferase
MNLARSSGILLHPTSLPGPYGIGELGPSAYRFVDYLSRARQTLWQVLPLGPTGYGDSPYAPFSTFAGNELLICLDTLLAQGLLSPEELRLPPSFAPERTEYGLVQAWKRPLLEAAAERFLDSIGGARRSAFEAFAVEEAAWLDDYVLFMDIKETLSARKPEFGAMWSNSWPKSLALKDGEALGNWARVESASLTRRKALQFLFFEQWRAVKAYANGKGISIIGDLPIFVAWDSADVWANRELFLLDAAGAPTAVAGVPPDYFSEDGQLWGNPLYDWEAHEKTGFSWWIRRLEFALKHADFIRLDHFRGLESFWAVPFGAPNARRGSWLKAPGERLLAALKDELGHDIPILAEDLGLITEPVARLRDEFGLPGMRVLQFAFDTKESGGAADPGNGFLPHNYGPGCVIYTGTHDNDTLRGWLDKASPEDLGYARRYLGTRARDLAWPMIREAMKSVAAMAVFPLQDLLGLGSEARMNAPSTLGGNWEWRATEGSFPASIARRLAGLSALYGRNFPRGPGA